MPRHTTSGRVSFQEVTCASHADLPISTSKFPPKFHHNAAPKIKKNFNTIQNSAQFFNFSPLYRMLKQFTSLYFTSFTSSPLPPESRTIMLLRSNNFYSVFASVSSVINLVPQGDSCFLFIFYLTTRPFTAHIRVSSGNSLCQLCGGQSDTGKDFAPRNSKFHRQHRSKRNFSFYVAR
jgi:hypothetical protein